MKVVELDQGSQEWLDHRMNYIGSSDAASIMGVGFMTPYELYMSKLGLHVTEENFAMRRGKELEPIALEKLNEESGIEFKPLCVVSSKYPFMAASLDGYNQEANLICEIKTGGQNALEMVKKGQVQPYYFAQIQHQLLVTELDKCILYFFDGHDGYTIEVLRDTRYINQLIDAETKFWSNLLNFVPPELTEKDYVFQGIEWQSVAKELMVQQEIIRNAEAKEKELREKLIELSQGKNSCGGGIKATKIARKGNVKYQDIPELLDVDIEKYRGSTIFTWRITKQK